MVIKIGRLGRLNFHQGIYLYTGSALGRGPSGLEGRISRHLRVVKKARWHIDYLLSSTHASVMDVILSEADRKLECVVHKALLNSFNTSQVVTGFGSSDCREVCGGHLTYLKGVNRNTALSVILQTYHHLRLTPKLLNIPNSIYYPSFSSISCMSP